MQKKIDDMKAKMEKTLDVLAGEFKTLRAGRANPAIIDRTSRTDEEARRHHPTQV